MTAQPIRATSVDYSVRDETLQRHFGPVDLTVRFSLHKTLVRVAPECGYTPWHLYELSNGGLYIAPELETVRLIVHSSGFDAQVSGDTAGIVTCLLAFNELSANTNAKWRTLSDHYSWLRTFAMEHPQAARIVLTIL